ncbi:hypothetical protein C8F04DRAFT_1190350 [Mycena alexandri]|uniref:Uncharacterized protein n=1 Tax=Mycena alexandri TaxID=1745969 RepID=A0AAD6SGR6_9AGAR|nr:hypothetical protein C8F04DRAFT_1190350 [Mycena alexandri]
MHYSYDYYSQMARRASKSYGDVAESRSIASDQDTVISNTQRAQHLYDIHHPWNLSFCPSPVRKSRIFCFPHVRCTKACTVKLPTQPMPPEEAPLTILPNQPQISQSHTCGTQFVDEFYDLTTYPTYPLASGFLMTCVGDLEGEWRVTRWTKMDPKGDHLWWFWMNDNMCQFADCSGETPSCGSIKEVQG